MNQLKHKIILGIRIATDKKAMQFLTNEGSITVRADGDCCSSTWIEHIELPARGFPATVLNIENLYTRREDRDDWEVVQHYGLKVSTDRGDLVVDYRNSSNGYYGGNLVWPVGKDEYDPFYGGVYGQNVSTQDWVPVTEDI